MLSTMRRVGNSELDAGAVNQASTESWPHGRRGPEVSPGMKGTNRGRHATDARTHGPSLVP